MLSQIGDKVFHVGSHLIDFFEEVGVLLLLVSGVNTHPVSFGIETLVILSPQLIKILLTEPKHRLMVQSLLNCLKLSASDLQVDISRTSNSLILNMLIPYFLINLIHKVVFSRVLR